MKASRMPVTFLASPDRVPQIRELDVEEDWRYFSWSDTIWIDQTYLHLREAGYDVGISAELPDDGMVVYHPSAKDRHGRLKFGDLDLVTVAVRADGGPQYGADFEIVQNERSGDGRRCHAVAHWPQPVLRPRDPERGDTVRNVAYKGDLGNLHPGFRSDEWRRMLEDRGLRWHEAAQGFPDGTETDLTVDWNDYSEVDVVMAVRPDPESNYPKKPASKLVNAWHAGVPALLGPEVAYRELRRSPVDYIEVRSPSEALSALDRLRADPELYRRMAENAEERKKEFSSESITARWAEILFDIIPDRAESVTARATKSIPGPLRYRVRKTLDSGFDSGMPNARSASTHSPTSVS